MSRGLLNVCRIFYIENVTPTDTIEGMAVSIKSNQRIYGTADAAKFLRLGTDTVRQYVHRGILHPCGEVSGRYMFEESELQRYERERKSPGRQRSDN